MYIQPIQVVCVPIAAKQLQHVYANNKKKLLIKGDGIVRISRETKVRGGKGVSLISGLSLDDDAIKQLSGKLKKLCGTGGTVKDGVIEIQGDQRDKLLIYLSEQGYKVKLAGG